MRFTAFALLLAMSSTSAFATELDLVGMNSGVDMLKSSAEVAFKEYGIEGNPMLLSLEQLAEISGVIAMNESTEITKSKIEAAIARE